MPKGPTLTGVTGDLSDLFCLFVYGSSFHNDHDDHRPKAVSFRHRSMVAFLGFDAYRLNCASM